MDLCELGQLNASVGPEHPALGEFMLWWLSVDSDFLEVKGCDKFEHGNIRNHPLLPLPFTADSVAVTLSLCTLGCFTGGTRCLGGVTRFLVASMGAVNSVDIRYTFERKDLTDFKKKNP